jgi:tetratricopeptide (TPR) repeat protein
MEAAMDAGDWQLADRYGKQALIVRPDDPELLTKLAKINAYSDRKREAAFLLVDAARLANYQPASRVNFAIQTLIDVGEIYPAIELLEQSLMAHPDEDDQRRILVGFWMEVQRPDRIGEHLQKLIQKRKFDFLLLVSTTDTSSRRLSEQTSRRLLQRNPEDRRVRLADAFLYLYRHDAGGAAEVLEDILDHHPDFAPAHAMYGQVLSAGSRWQAMPQWLQQAPPESQDFADYWLTFGDVAIANGRPAEAARAYWEATRRDPNRDLAWDRLRLSLQLLRSGESEYRDRITEAQLSVISEHFDHLQSLREKFNDFTAGGRESQTSATQVARELFHLGRLWEAEAWSAAATTLGQQPSQELAALRQAIIARLRRDSAWFAQDTPALNLDLSFLPQPRLDSSSDAQPPSTVVPALASVDHLRLSEQSEAWGLLSVGQGNNPTNARLAALIRSTGVGGGAIDYDLDGLADLLMVNAGGTMLEADSMPNELLRNLGDSFFRVSDRAGVGDKGFGQGLAVGDFNEDGFADLFFANLGKNRLLRNNGDGTFTDCTQLLQGDVQRRWSTSACFVDFSADSIADLVVTSYCQTVPDLDKACPNEEGVLGPCHPLRFPADVDQFFASTPQGRWVNVTADSIDQTTPGRGLGIVSGSLDSQNLGIFIANDMSRNHFYAPAEGAEPRLIDSASPRGLAVDGLSRAQASMGIASSDFDLDGDLDFYVTGFAREYNVYYEQISAGLWKDETSKLGLVEPTLMMVGFGTQAIDMDNDGIDEIIVTNGHIGEFSDPEVPPYEQPLQIFRRNERGSFVLLDDDAWGSYFRTPHVGRALWTTDVNRDGRNDVLITHTHEQLRLLLNHSEDHNDRIAFRLVATRCSRDGVGAVLRFRCHGQTRTLWLLSGDGYMCSNEKTLIAGLGRADQVTDVTVTWQDGSMDEVGTLDANSQYLIVQGQGEAFAQHRYAP